jgi:hypothetical protein
VFHRYWYWAQIWLGTVSLNFFIPPVPVLGPDLVGDCIIELFYSADTMVLLVLYWTGIDSRLGSRLGSATRIGPRLGSRLGCWGGSRRGEFSGSTTTQNINNCFYSSHKVS